MAIALPIEALICAAVALAKPPFDFKRAHRHFENIVDKAAEAQGIEDQRLLALLRLSPAQRVLPDKAYRVAQQQLQRGRR